MTNMQSMGGGGKVPTTLLESTKYPRENHSESQVEDDWRDSEKKRKQILRKNDLFVLCKIYVRVVIQIDFFDFCMKFLN